MRSFKFFVLSGFILVLTACSGPSSDNQPEPLNLSIIHMNDTHSHLDALTNEELYFDGVKTRTDLGGAARMKTAIDTLSEDNENTLILHAGDAVQGTLYYTAFGGEADFALLNYYGIDAMTLGNHEFDKGPESVANYIAWADFPIVSANIDAEAEPLLRGKILPYTLKVLGHNTVAIIGATTEDTESTSSPGENVKFENVEQSVRNTVNLLKGFGLNKIILLSHIGYEEDIELAESVPGIDVIVGGHSHTLLGDQAGFAEFGITVPAGYDYPTVVESPEGRDVLVVQAWCWGRAIGELNVSFDANGEITSYSGHPYLLNSEIFKQNYGAGWVVVGPDVQDRIMALILGSELLDIFDEDAGAEAILQPYTDQIAEKKKTVVAAAAEDILRGNAASSFNSGPGPIVADSMIFKTSSQGVSIAIQPRGGVKADFLAGNITMGDVLSVLPYNSLLTAIEMTGAEIKNALEDGIDYQVVNNPRGPSNCPWYPYVSGLKFDIIENAAKGSRVTNIQYRSTLGGGYMTFDLGTTYRIAVTAYLAGGGDGYTTLRNIPASRKTDTGFIDSDAFSEYLASLGTVSNPTEIRITVTY
jgi:5'-nucleotidase / UDP-sugar diphosphatase